VTEILPSKGEQGQLFIFNPKTAVQQSEDHRIILKTAVATEKQTQSVNA